MATSTDADRQPSPVGGLPDVILEEVLALLSVEELLLARLVCRRWRRLVGSPVVWRHRKLRGTALAAAVVRIAPCVASLDLFSFGIRDPRTYEQLATTRLSVRDMLEASVGYLNRNTSDILGFMRMEAMHEAWGHQVIGPNQAHGANNQPNQAGVANQPNQAGVANQPNQAHGANQPNMAGVENQPNQAHGAHQAGVVQEQPLGGMAVLANEVHQADQPNDADLADQVNQADQPNQVVAANQPNEVAQAEQGVPNQRRLRAEDIEAEYDLRIVCDQPDLDVAIVLNQLDLGGVKRLLLTFCGTRDRGDQLVQPDEMSLTKPRYWRPCELQLLRQVLAQDGLLHLRLKVWGNGLLPEAEAEAVVPAAVGRPSLRVLEVDGGFPRPVVDFLLAQHAATLEEAEFQGELSLPAIPPDAALLGRASRLRVLSVPVWPGLAELPQVAATLKDLTLTKSHRPQGYEERRSALNAGRCFLGAASGLQALTLAGFTADEALDLVAAAAAADPADHPLTRLVLVTPEQAERKPFVLGTEKLGWLFDKIRQVQAVVPGLRRLSQELLPSLSNLAELIVYFQPGPEFFAALHAGAAPALTGLSVVSDGNCTHRWLHESGALAALHRLPRLHLRCLDPVRPPTLCAWLRALLQGGGPCAACDQACHEVAVDKDMALHCMRSAAFYTHGDEGGCAAKEHALAWGWVRV